MQATQFKQHLGLFVPGTTTPLMTTVWGYNGSYPGPTIMATKGKPINIFFPNRLQDRKKNPLPHLFPIDTTMMWALSGNPNWQTAGVPLVPHLHGGHVESVSDGLPEAWYTPNFKLNLDNPDQMAILRDDPTKIEVGVEELLRWVTPIKNMSRTVTREVELHGETLHEGDQLVLMYPAANRDPRVFTDPDTLDVQRNPNPHLAFGFGPHFCMGASLARMELRVMFGELLRRLPDLHLAGDPLPRRSSNFISGPEAMPVAFTPTA